MTESVDVHKIHRIFVKKESVRSENG